MEAHGEKTEPEAELLIEENYPGYVTHVDSDYVVVVYETDEDIVEHTYSPKQFINGTVPKVDDYLLVTVQVKTVPKKPVIESDVQEALRKMETTLSSRTKITGPMEF